MKIGIGLAAALAVAMLSPSAAFAQGKPDKAADAALAKTRTAGMAEAPGALQVHGLSSCVLADAIFLGESNDKGADGKKVKSKVYEVACQDGSGYVIGNPSPTPISCLVLETVANQVGADGKKKTGGTTCKLPANADPKRGILNSVKSAGVSCTVDKARWVGASASTKVDVYEVGCSDGQASLVTVPQAGSTEKLVADNCIKVMSRDGGPCQSFTKAAAVSTITAMAAKAGRPACQVTDGRWVATKTAGGDFYEVGCADGKSGYMLETEKGGAFSRAIDCARAEPIAGGCTLTTTAVAGDTEDVNLYNAKAKEIGFACNVTKYRSLGLDGPNGREVVELACSDREDGAFALLPVSAGQKGETYNCIRSEARNQTCKLSKKQAVFPKLINQLQNKGKACQVAETRGIGQTADQQDVVEVKCTGAPGLVAVFNKASDGILQVMDCNAAKAIGGGCKLQ